MIPNKKILLVYYKLFKPGGVARVFTNLANSLDEEGFEVDILLLMHEQPHFFFLNPSIKVYNIDTFSHWAWKICVYNKRIFRRFSKINNINAYIYHIGVFLMLRNWMRLHHQNYDTIISAWYKLSAFLAINKNVNQKTIAWEHVSYEIGGVLYKDLLRRYYKNLKSIVCINSPALRHYQSFNKTALIPNIIGEPFESQPEVCYETKENLISFVGRLDKDKNVIDLLEIFNESKLPKNWRLQIIGEGTQRQYLEKFVKDNRLTNQVMFLGVKTSEQILSLLRLSKIFAFTSLKEALPTVLVEAMFCGNTIVSYNCKDGPEDIVTDKTGFLIKIHDKEKFKKTLELLAKNEELLNSCMINAQKEAQNWKKEEIIKQWKTIL